MNDVQQLWRRERFSLKTGAVFYYYRHLIWQVMPIRSQSIYQNISLWGVFNRMPMEQSTLDLPLKSKHTFGKQNIPRSESALQYWAACQVFFLYWHLLHDKIELGRVSEANGFLTPLHTCFINRADWLQIEVKWPSSLNTFYLYKLYLGLFKNKPLFLHKS